MGNTLSSSPNDSSQPQVSVFRCNERPIVTLLIEPIANTGSTSRVGTKKILHVVNGEHYAGAARVQDLLALALPKLGYEVSFACVLPDKFPERRKSQDSPLYEFPMKNRLDFEPARRIVQLVKDEGFSIIHSHTTRSAMIASAAARLAGVPYVHHVHCQMDTEVGQRLQSFVNKSIEKMACRTADQVIAVSGSIKRFLQDNRFTRRPIGVVPNGVPQAALQKTPREDGQPWTIGMVALLRERKGLETLMHSLPELQRKHDVRLRIVGPFESEGYRNRMYDLSDSLGITSLIDWTGFASDVNSEICKMDVLVLPSVLPEGMPMVLLEAMAAGVPIIGSNVDGISDVIRHRQNGLLADPGDASSLTAQLGEMLVGNVDWHLMRYECQNEYAQKYSDSAMAVGVARIYDQLLHQQ